MGQPFYAYLLECSDGSYYVGHTDDLQMRLAQHEQGASCEHTRRRLPVRLIWREAFGTREEAQLAEHRIKGWNRAKKQALIAGRFDMISRLASRGSAGRALRDALLRRAPQGRG